MVVLVAVGTGMDVHPAGALLWAKPAGLLWLCVRCFVVVVVVLKWGSMAGDAQDEVRIVVMVVRACELLVGVWMVAVWQWRAAAGC